MIAQLREPRGVKRLADARIVVRERPLAGEARPPADALFVRQHRLAVQDEPRQRARPLREDARRHAAAHANLVRRLVERADARHGRARRGLRRLPVCQLVVRDLPAARRPRTVFLQRECDPVEVLGVGADEARVRLRQNEVAFALRREVRHRKRPARDLHAVREERPCAVIGVRERERRAVDEFRPPRRRVRADDLQILLDVRDFRQLGRPLALRADDAVHAEVRVVGPLVPVAAIAPIGDALPVRPNAVGVDLHRLVIPVPDAAAGKRRMRAIDVPILAEVAHRVAHRVRILALVERRPFREPRELLQRQVAVAVDLEVLVVVAVHVEARVVERQHRAVRNLVVGACPRLVAERPEVDGRMVAVERHHARATLRDAFRPRRRIGERLEAVIGSVRLHVRLALHVEPVAVAQVVEVGVVRIVRRAHGVEIALLHEEDVLPHLLARHGAAVDGRGVVAVHALELQRLAVEQDLARRRQPHLAEADLARADVVALREDKRVEVGILRAPEAHVLHRRFHGTEVGVVERPRRAGAVDLDAPVEMRPHGIVADAVRRLGPKRDAPVDAGEAEEVLILQIAAVRPAVDLDGEGVKRLRS